IKFNEYMDKASAQQVSNYSINNNISISSAILQDDKKTVILNTSNITLQVENQITVSNLKNSTGIALNESIVQAFTLNEVLERINAGGPQIEINTVVWDENKYSSGGSAFSRPYTI